MVQPREEMKKKAVFVRDENTTKHLLNSFEKIFSMLCVCWKKTGLVPENSLYEPYNPNTLNLRYDSANLVGMSKQIIEIFKPLGVTFLEPTVESFVENWIANNEAGDSPRDAPNPMAENAKILDVVLHLEVAPIRLLYSMLGGKQLRTLAQTKRYSQYKKDKDLIVSRKVMTYECSFLSFLFAYLKLLTTTDNIAFELYGILSKILHQFDATSTPATLCWIIDVLSLALDKFPLDFGQFATLKAEFVNLVSDLISRCLKVILKDTVISYRETDKPFKMIYPLSPTAQEYLSHLHNKVSLLNNLNNEESDLTSRDPAQPRHLLRLPPRRPALPGLLGRNSPPENRQAGQRLFHRPQNQKLQFVSGDLTRPDSSNGFSGR
jgi:hypothetical protein